MNLYNLWPLISWTYPHSRYASYLVISLVRCRSFPSSNADTQASSLSLDGQIVLQVKEGGVSTTTSETPLITTQLRTDWEGGKPTMLSFFVIFFKLIVFYFDILKLNDITYGRPPSFCRKVASISSQQHHVVMPTDGWRDTCLEPNVSLSGSWMILCLEFCFKDILLWSKIIWHSSNHLSDSRLQT